MPGYLPAASLAERIMRELHKKLMKVEFICNIYQHLHFSGVKMRNNIVLTLAEDKEVMIYASGKDFVPLSF